jgi:putative ABC transport system substrate-binding protein
MAIDIARRKFIAVLGGTAVTWPLAARAQLAGKVVRIGVLGPSLNSAATAANYQAFLAELRQLGFSEGQNLIIEYRRVDDPRGPFAMAAELMRANIDLLVADGPEVALQAVVGASRAIPIVIVAVNYDPVERSYVASLARPGGNITGVFLPQSELAAKQLDLLTQAFPTKSPLAILWDELSTDQFGAAKDAAKLKRLELSPLKLEKPPYDFDAAFRTLTQSAAQMVLVLSSPFFTEYRALIAELALRHRLPSMFIFKSYVEAGGLMSYGVDRMPMLRLAASYVAKILNGAKPADLPVEQATKYELVINLKTAKALGLTIPQSLLATADEVIE